MSWAVKLRAPKEKRFMLLGSKGSTTWRRVHTLRFELQESAERYAEEVKREHPALKEWDWKVVPLRGGYN